MPCGCGKKSNTGTIHFMGREGSQIADPEDWGPILWKYLHCLTEKLGTTGNKIVDTDQANYMENIINNLHFILPCTECQEHTASYIATHPLPSLKGLYGESLKTTVRSWLFNFHNNVRSRKNKQILVNSEEEYRTLYTNCFVPKCEYSLFVQSVAYAVRQGWVRIDHWKKWYNFSERMRVLSGNLVI